jgi:glycosyltransferase involved in cell wall biosynthesis
MSNLSDINNPNNRGLYIDLVRELRDKKNNVFVVSPIQKRFNKDTKYHQFGNISVLEVKTGNLTKTPSKIERGLSLIFLQRLYLKAMKKYFRSIDFDLIIYSTPPITFSKIIRKYRKRNKAKTYLMLKDIFPQNAVDLGMLKKKGCIWRYFRRKEIELYNLSDYIGCMSEANKHYLVKHNCFVDARKVEVFPNAIKPIDRVSEKSRDVLEKYLIPKEQCIFLYGGNLGKPQGPDFLIEVIKNFEKVNGGFLVIVGNGTEFKKIQETMIDSNIRKVLLLERLSKLEYDSLAASVDVGLIFLDQRFTIPNFPSRFNSLLENGLPVIAATDNVTDMGEVIVSSNCGYWSLAGEIDDFIENCNRVSMDKDLRIKMGINSIKLLKSNYNISNTVGIMLNHMKEV